MEWLPPLPEDGPGPSGMGMGPPSMPQGGAGGRGRGRGAGPNRGGRGPQHPEAGGGRGTSARWEKIARQRQETHAVLLKEQLQRTKFSVAMAGAQNMDEREAILEAPPELPPSTSFNDIPRVSHSLAAAVLLDDDATVLPPTAADQLPQQDHAAGLATCLDLLDRRHGGSGREHSKGGGTFDVSVNVAAVIHSSK